MEDLMAEAKKKATKTAAKPKSSTSKNGKLTVEKKSLTPSREEIADLARKYWAERGWQDGQAEQDWLRAEQELRGIAS
jgi:hypothetical protein